MKENEINQEIKSYLEQDEMDYWEGVELYSEHPKKRNNVVLTLNQRWQKSTMHEKLVYELEKIVGNKPTNRKTILNQRPAVLPFKVIEETKDEAPQNYEYKIAYEKLPKELQAIVIEKGQLYNALEQKKKELADIGEQNDDKSVAKRGIILKDMRRMSDRIKKIHSLLMIFDENKGFVSNKKLKPETANKIACEAKQFYNELEILKTRPVGGTDEKPQEEETKELSLEDELDKEFQYQNMNYWKRKDLLVKLRSSVNKQEKRAKSTNKEKIKEKNLLKVEMGKSMIYLLEKYFKENEEPDTDKTSENNTEEIIEPEK